MAVKEEEEGKASPLSLLSAVGRKGKVIGRREWRCLYLSLKQEEEEKNETNLFSSIQSKKKGNVGRLGGGEKGRGAHPCLTSCLHQEKKKGKGNRNVLLLGCAEWGGVSKRERFPYLHNTFGWGKGKRGKKKRVPSILICLARKR